MNIPQRLQKGVELQTNNKVAEAEAIYLEILKEKPDDPDANHLLGLIRSDEDQYDEALARIEKAMAINPKASAFHHNIAGIYRRLGQIEEAERQFREAIRLKPNYGEAYQGLAEVKKFKNDDPVFPLLLEQLKDPSHPDQLRQYFHFAAAKLYDDFGDHDTAFRHYLQGNKMAHRDFDSTAHRQQVKDTIYTYSKNYLARRGVVGNKSDLPVFIVGMPRSGTSLVEQIIASHSSVFGAGELNDMKGVAKASEDLSSLKVAWPNCMPQVNENAIQRLAQSYLRRLRSHADSEAITRIIDKHPLNFRFVGLIFDLFPNAKIIHTRRDRMDTCVSCFFQNFTKGQDYSFDLRKLAHFYNDYARLMEHWDQLYPGRILHMDYEELVANQERESRRLVDFIGLDWEEACLQFHKTDRVVKTASFMQVRQPIYKSSQGRWKRYANHLREVAAILGLKVEQPVTISTSHAWVQSGI